MIKIRAAKYDDSEALAQIQVDSYRSAYAGILPQSYLDAFSYEEQTQDWRDLLVQPQSFILLIAEGETGEVIGYALGHAGETALPPYDSELDALHVRRADQRQGAGRALITAMAQSLADEGAAAMMLWVLKQNPARALYERLGGQPLGHRSVTLDEGDTMADELAYGWDDIRLLTG
jgi:ribosomal protein S18 acetylase RimI-like enzyme